MSTRVNTCYICNKEGHFARECDQKRPERENNRGYLHHYLGPREMKCYNCQGTGHIARDCPSERQERQDRPERSYNQRSTGSKCYNCQQFGHMAKDCTKTQGQKECYNCKKVGHISRECPEGGDDRRKTVECHKCHEQGHFARDCKSNIWIKFRLNEINAIKTKRGSMIFHLSI